MTRSAFRAAATVAWRTARRNRRRSLLVLVMIALPIALVTATATVARTIVGSPQDEVTATMGAADLMLSIGDRFDPERAQRRLPSGSEIVTMKTVFTDLVADGELRYATLAEIDASLEKPIFDGLYDLREGRTPARAGEAAVNQAVLDVFAVEVGDEVLLGDRTLTVTGVVRTRDLDELVAVVGPSTLKTNDASDTALIDLPANVDMEKVIGRLNAHGVTTRASIAEMAAADANVWDAVSLVGGVLALFATGLIAAAAFVVGARRQLRQLGIVGAIGGDGRHVRAVVWLAGTTLGLAGGVIGTAVGITIALAIHPHLDRVVRRVVGPLDVNVFVLVAAVVMGVAAATLAALSPARSAGRLSVMAALAGSTPPLRPPGRIAGAGFVVLLGGGAITGWATLRDQNSWLAAGLVAMLVGVLMWIPMLVLLTGRIASSLPLTGRLAARDAARHGRRTGAAVAAAVIALAVPVAVATYSLSEETFERRQPRLGADMLLIGQMSDVSEHGAADLIASWVASTFPEALVVPLKQTTVRRNPARRGLSVLAFGAKEVLRPGVSTLSSWPLFIADEEMLRAVHAERAAAALDDGKALVLGGFETNKGFIRVQMPNKRRQRSVRLPAVAVDSPAYFNESLPRMVISERTADELGLSAHVAQHLVTFPRPVTGDDIERARSVVADEPGFFVNSNEDYLPKYAAARSAVTAATVPLGLGVLAVAVALVTSESRRSHQILVAVGASRGAHRKVVAATSGLLAVIAGVLAVPAGILPTMIVEAASQAGRPLVVPWVTLGIVVILTPLLSATVAALLARTPRLGTLLTPST